MKMKRLSGRVGVHGWPIVYMVVIMLVGGVALAAEYPTFTSPDAVSQWMRNDPGAMMRWCVQNLTQKQLDEISALAIPPMTEDERLQAIKDAKALLERAGASAPAKAADTEIKALEYQKVKARAAESVAADPVGVHE